MAGADLRCPNGCDAGRFEALNAPLYVGPDAHYLGHDASAATYRCVECGAIALDLAAVSRELLQDEAAAQQVLTCPGCGTMMLPPEDDPTATVMECPECGTHFLVEEGQPRLHQDGYEIDLESNGT